MPSRHGNGSSITPKKRNTSRIISSRFQTNTERVKAFGIHPDNMFYFLGLGRRTLLALVRHRPLHRLYHRLPKLHGPPRRRLRNGPPLQGNPLRKEHSRDPRAHRHLVQQLLRGPDGSHFPLRSVHASLPRPTFSKATWKATENPSTGKAISSRIRPGPSSGANRAPTASTPFYQLLHQGTKLIPADFLAPAISHNPGRKTPFHPALQLLRPDRGAHERKGNGKR